MLLIVTTFAANAQESPFGSYTYDGSGNIISNKALNPDGKPVVVYGPNLGKHAVQTLQKTGAIVVRTLDELKAVAQ